MKAEVTDTTVIAIGEPGCYANYGHVDGDAVLRVVLDLWEEDPEHLEPARHTYMTITDCDDNPAPYKPNGDLFYQEVSSDTPNAHPFTIIAVDGYWERSS